MGNIPDLVSRLLELTEHLTPAEIGQAVGADANYVRMWRRGRRPSRMGVDMRRRIEHYIEGRERHAAMALPSPAISARGAVLQVSEVPNGYVARLGDAALIAVGRFEAIEQMAGELARIAGQSARDLAAANASVAVSQVSVAGQADRPAAPAAESHRARNSGPRRSG